jgi:hypothetical protein
VALSRPPDVVEPTKGTPSLSAGEIEIIKRLGEQGQSPKQIAKTTDEVISRYTA